MSNPRPDNPYLRKPDNPNYLHRSFRHDYKRPARYLITLSKSPAIPRFSNITGNNDSTAALQITRTGHFFEEALAIWLGKYPQIKVANHVVMPDHIHICVDVRDYLPSGLSRAIASLKSATSSLRHNALPIQYKINGIQSVFTPGFNDRIAYTPQQWQRQIAYINDNPRRYIIKNNNPEFLLRRRSIIVDNKEYSAIGNIFLLDAPSLLQIKYSRHFTEREAADYAMQSKALIDNGSIPISPFIHPKEKELRDYAIEAGSSIIRICDNGFTERQFPSGIEFQLISAGRLLLISPATHNTQHTDMKYAVASEMNRLAHRLATLCNNNSPLYPTPQQ